MPTIGNLNVNITDDGISFGPIVGKTAELTKEQVTQVISTLNNMLPTIDSIKRDRLVKQLLEAEKVLEDIQAKLDAFDKKEVKKVADKKDKLEKN